MGFFSGFCRVRGWWPDLFQTCDCTLKPSVLAAFALCPAEEPQQMEGSQWGLGALLAAAVFGVKESTKTL